MEKYRYRSDHHLKKKIKNIRNLVTYRFAEKTFALLTVIGTDLNDHHTHTTLVLDFIPHLIPHWNLFIGEKL